MEHLAAVFKILCHKIISKFMDVNHIHRSVILNDKVKIKRSRIHQDTEIGLESIISDSTILNNCLIGRKNWIKGSDLPSRFVSGENCKIYESQLFGNIKIGRYTSLWGPNLDIHSGNKSVVIGSFCSIARNVSMQTYNHNSKKITTYFIGQNLFNEKWTNEHQYKELGIVIKNDVWVGSHSVILGGVTIHNGAIVAANSVVNRDVPAFSIVGGSPAKIIGYRFDEETIKKIEQLAWWEWPIEKIFLNKELFENELDNIDSYSIIELTN